MFGGSKQTKLQPILDQTLLTPANKLSKQIKDGSLTAVKLCQIYTEQIKSVQPIINAVVQDRFNSALEEAKKIDELLERFRVNDPASQFTADELELLQSPLLGVPISIKESIKFKGMRNTCGLWANKDVIATENAVVVDNVRRLGMIPICFTNVPECTFYWADCQNTIYGRTLNPYNLSRVTGASSGGEGSLLAAGASVIGIGSDIGGSLRNPAHYCGINSHKPSPFLVSGEGNNPDVQEFRRRIFTMGPMCRYASDLRPLLKCLMSDKDNSKQDTYFRHQPEDISTLRRTVLQKLDEPAQMSQVKIFYYNFDECKLKGKHSIQLGPDFMETQREILDHFRSKFNCQVEQIDVSKYLRYSLVALQCMLIGGGTVDRETDYDENELTGMFGIDNVFLEFIKIPLGLSKHTKESLFAFSLGSTIPKDKTKAFAICEKFEKLVAEWRAEFTTKLGDDGVFIMPTLPTVAHKNNISLIKTQDLRFPTLFNILQVPVTHVTLKLDKKHKMPFGFSIVGKPYNDQLTISVAEEIESAFGGWRQPVEKKLEASSKSKIDEKQTPIVGQEAKGIPTDSITK